MALLAFSSRVPVVRSLAAPQQQQPPVLEAGLHIVAVPSNPLSQQIAPLNIDADGSTCENVWPHSLLH